jgi:hypothetical protein
VVSVSEVGVRRVDNELCRGYAPPEGAGLDVTDD